MEWVETTGRSLEEAKEAALDELGVDEQDAEFEVVAEARVGLFGRLRSEARVRARVRPTAPRAKEDRRDRRRRRKVDDSDSGAASESPQAAEGGDGPEEATTPTRARRPKATTRASRTAAPAQSEAASSDAEVEVPDQDDASHGGNGAGVEAEVAPPTTNGRTRARSAAGAGGGRNRRAPSSPPPVGTSSRAKPEEAGQVEVALAEQGQVAEDFLRGLIGELGLGADIRTSQPDEDTLEVDLEGSDLGVLIGQKGATLFALQDLTRTVVQRRTGASNGRLLVDVSGYRHKRHEALARFAEQVAQTVLTSGARKAMEPMNAADRKVVHDTLNDVAGVSTASEGEDPRRYVVVLPGG